VNAATGSTVRVMSWNIHGAVGRNPRFDLDRVITLIRRWAPDVVALQEVDSRRKFDNGENPFAVLQSALGKHGVEAKSIITADGEYGQMLISCCPLVSSEVHDVSWPEREPRRVIKARVETPLGGLSIIATHLGLSIRERRSQTEELSALIGRSGGTTVVMGDLNDWFWVNSVRSVLARTLPAHTDYRTFPSFLPLLRLDRIYCRPGSAMVRSFVDPEARHISDHLPVIADLRV
jgi:endonuclease/exonuclease/phosphatase family metal-dependent hydrolase